MKDYKGNATGLFTGIVEVWKEVNGYEGIYQVSSFGEVRSVDRACVRSDGYVLHYKSKVLKKELKRNDYYTCTLCNVSRKNMFVHRLVALAFICNPEEKKTVNHIDGNRLNNKVSNLEWSTHYEQTQHAILNNLMPDIIGKKYSTAFKQTVQDHHKLTGCSFYELAHVFSIDRSSAVRFAKGLFNLRKLKLVPNDLPEINILISQGKTLEEIATQFNCCSRSVYEFLKKHKEPNGNS